MESNELEDQEERSVRRTALRGAFGVIAFWLVLMAALYGVFSYSENERQARFAPYTLASGELVIPRGRDGHFRVPGAVNGHPVEFLVDTGASLVTVSEEFARAAAPTPPPPWPGAEASPPRSPCARCSIHCAR